MNIGLAYLDHKSASIDIREKFSYTSAKIREMLREIKGHPDVSGVVILATCNRTELYISGRGDNKINPLDILSPYIDKRNQRELSFFNIKYDKEAVLHLMEVACGLQSMVLCEDQIITQVKNAALLAREEKAADAVLETIFRLASTASKKAKTEVVIKVVPSSAAESAVAFLAKNCDLSLKKVLVIGNGETGRLCCNKLVELGAEVTVTLRQYKHGAVIIPNNCNTIKYDERMTFFSTADIVISSTASPHYTVTFKMLDRLAAKPVYLLDLALPRDIEPRVSEIQGIACYNLDEFCEDYTQFNINEINEIKRIINKFYIQFEKWSSFREGIDSEELIKSATAE